MGRVASLSLGVPKVPRGDDGDDHVERREGDQNSPVPPAGVEADSQRSIKLVSGSVRAYKKSEGQLRSAFSSGRPQSLKDSGRRTKLAVARRALVVDVTSCDRHVGLSPLETGLPGRRGENLVLGLEALQGR